MFIAIRKEPNGSLYIDKNIYSRTQEVQDENGNIITQPLFTDETLSQPPYNYTKVEIDNQYSDCQASDFDEDLTFNLEKYNNRKLKEKNIKLIDDYKRKLTETDYKAIKYAEGLISETDYTPIKAERENYRKAINSLEISLK